MATVIKKDGSHAGIIYLNEDLAAYKILHLSGHFGLGVDDPSDDFRWIKINLPPSDLKYLAALCLTVSLNQPGVPYGFAASGITFDPSTGALINIQRRSGLSCATFVLALFASVGMEVVDESTWPVNANIEWQTAVIKQFENAIPRRPYLQPHLDLLQSDLGSARITPYEAVMAPTLTVWPGRYADVTDLARKLSDELSILSSA